MSAPKKDKTAYRTQATQAGVPTPEIRDTVTISQILYRQIERVNTAGSAEEGAANFEQAVDILFQMIPNSVRMAIVARVKEYKVEDEVPVFRFNAGTPMGTLENPIKDKKGGIISPVMTKKVYVDYRVLYNIIMQELERAKITWRYDPITMELGKVRMPVVDIPLESIERAKMEVEKLLKQDEEVGFKYSFYDLVKRILPEVPPPTPTLEENSEADAEPEGDALPAGIELPEVKGDDQEEP